MSYTQNNPFSRKSSPLNDFDDLVTKLEGQGKSHESAVKIAGSVANAKMHGAGSGPTAKQKARHGMSRRPKEKPSTKPVEETRMTKGDQMPSRKSSSPLNQDERSGYSTWDKIKGTAKNVGSYLSDVGGKMRQANIGFRDTDYDIDYHSVGSGFTKAGEHTGGDKGIYKSKADAEAARLEQSSKERKGRVSEGSAFFRESSSPLNNTGMTGLNYSKELRYNAIDDITQGKGEADYGMSRESSSPLDYGSWANEDATRAKELYKKGDYAHARALGIDEHDADYGKWKSSEAEHGMSRKSRSERLRSRAMKRSERSGAEWGDYDYEDKRVQKMLSKASKLDERSGGEMKMMMTRHMKPLPKKKA